MILTGKFARLRPLALDDAAVTFRWRQGMRGRFLQAGAQTVAEQQQWIQARSPDTEHNWIIEYRGVPVGMIALHDISRRHRSAILGRLLIGEAEVVGTAPVWLEAELLLCEFAFERLSLHKLYGGVLEDHRAMLGTRRYLGYQQDGVLREHLLINGVFHDWIAISLLENEYRSVCRPKLLQLIQLYSSLPDRAAGHGGNLE